MWTPTPLLTPVSALQQKIDRTVLASSKILNASLVAVDIHHIGSTALPPLLTGGTVDLLVLAETNALDTCEHEIAKLTSLQQLELPVQIRIGDRHTTHETLRLRHILATEPLFMGEYLGLQKCYAHEVGKHYRSAKQEFFEGLAARGVSGHAPKIPFDSNALLPHQIALQTERLRLHSPLSVDASEYANYRFDNRESHEAFGTFGPSNFDAARWAESFGHESLARLRRERLTFLVRTLGDNTLIGSVHFSGFLWRCYQQCYLGYNLAQAAEGNGFMGEALTAALAYVREEWGIHRVQAFYDPKNTKSAQLLKRLDFHTEGSLTSYICLDDKWRDCTLAARHWS